MLMKDVAIEVSNFLYHRGIRFVPILASDELSYIVYYYVPEVPFDPNSELDAKDPDESFDEIEKSKSKIFALKCDGQGTEREWLWVPKRRVSCTMSVLEFEHWLDAGTHICDFFGKKYDQAEVDERKAACIDLSSNRLLDGLMRKILLSK